MPSLSLMQGMVAILRPPHGKTFFAATSSNISIFPFSAGIFVIGRCCVWESSDAGFLLIHINFDEVHGVSAVFLRNIVTRGSGPPIELLSDPDSSPQTTWFF